MASPNRHWPSMFRSNLACDVQQQQQPDMNDNGGGSGSPTSSLLLSAPTASSGKPSLISSGCEEGTRNPEPKPRWNPRPEQIRILEGIFNSGMVNPPREDIRRIRMQLQEYGQVGDANVFYWFQNRKSRTKNKLRAAGQLQPGRAALARACVAAPAPMTPPRHLPAATGVAPTSSSSSSSDRSSGSSKSVKPVALTTSPVAVAQGMLPATAIDLLSPTPTPILPPPACQIYYHTHPMSTPTALTRNHQNQLSSQESLLQWPQSPYRPATELGGVLGSHTHTPFSPGVLIGLCNEALGQEMMDMSCSNKGFGHHYMDNNTCRAEIMSSKTDPASAVIMDDEKARLGLLHYGIDSTVTAATNSSAHHRRLAAPVHAAAADDASTATMIPITAAAASNAATNSALAFHLQGLLDAGLLGGAAPPPPPTATVVAVARDDDVTCTRTTQYSFPAMMHLNVKMFGEAAVLLRNSGEPVLVDDSGVTVEPLQQGALYYLLATEHAV